MNLIWYVYRLFVEYVRSKLELKNVCKMLGSLKKNMKNTIFQLPLERTENALKGTCMCVSAGETNVGRRKSFTSILSDLWIERERLLDRKLNPNYAKTSKTPTTRSSAFLRPSYGGRASASPGRPLSAILSKFMEIIVHQEPHVCRFVCSSHPPPTKCPPFPKETHKLRLMTCSCFRSFSFVKSG